MNGKQSSLLCYVLFIKQSTVTYLELLFIGRSSDVVDILLQMDKTAEIWS